MTCWKIASIATLIGSLAAGCFAQKGGAASDSASGGSSAEQILNKMQQKYSQVVGVQGQFTQTRVHPAFGEEFKVDAQFSILKPSLFKVEFAAPRASVNVLKDDTLYRYEPSTKNYVRHRLKRDVLAQDLGYLMLGFGAKTQDVLSRFTAKSSADGKQITFTPRKAGAGEYTEIIMQITDEYRPKQFTMTQPDKTKLIVSLGSVNLQAPLTAQHFDPSQIAPRGTKLVDMD